MSAFLELITAGLDPWAAGGLILASGVTSFLTTSFGLGGGALLLAIMASFIPSAALIPVHGLVQLGSNLSRSILMFRHVKWGPFWPFLLGTIVGVVIGGKIAINLPSSTVQILVGLFIIWTVWIKPPEWITRMAFPTGAFSSFLTMFVGATGPFVGSFVRAQGYSRLGFTGTHSVLMVCQHFLKSMTFVILGFPFLEWASLALFMVFTGFVGTYIGGKMLVKKSDAAFQSGLSVLLVLVALRLIYKGAFG